MSVSLPSNKEEAVKKLLNLLELLEESTAMALVGSTVHYDFDIPSDLWLAEADEDQLERAIHNLVISLLHSRPQQGAIHVSASNRVLQPDRARKLSLPGGNYIEVIIANPVGGQAAMHPQIIYKAGLTGIDSDPGLASAYTIINENGGRIISNSDAKEGTKFQIYLPASIDHFQVVEPVCEEIQNSGTGTVLIVDDEPEIRRLLDTILQRAGYKVEQSSNGEEAVAKYAGSKEAGQPFIAVIMDLTMPGNLGGKEATEQILAIDPFARIIVSSGYSTDPAVYDFAKYGFSGVITKPYNIDQLEAELKRVISTPTGLANLSEQGQQKHPPVEVRKILMMEDSNLIRTSISDCFSDLNYTIEFARDGGEALSKYKSAMESGSHFDAVVMDLTIRMGLSGVETMARLLEIDPRAKAIITSGYTTEEVMLKPMKYGFKEALAKPFSIDELVKALERTVCS